MAEQASSAPGPAGSGGPGAAAGEPRHGLRLLILWVVASAICCPLVYIVAGPHMPPGDMSSSAAKQQFDFTVLATIATPVVLGVLIYIGYALTFWRAKDGDETDGPPIHGNTRIQLTWIAVTSVIVLVPGRLRHRRARWVVVQGAARARARSRSGSRTPPTSCRCRSSASSGPGPTATRSSAGSRPRSSSCQWASRCSSTSPRWTSSTASGPTSSASRPTPTRCVNNVAYTTPKQQGSFVVRCSELCGLWHGAMYNYGKVVSRGAVPGLGPADPDAAGLADQDCCRPTP